MLAINYLSPLSGDATICINLMGFAYSEKSILYYILGILLSL